MTSRNNNKGIYHASYGDGGGGGGGQGGGGWGSGGWLAGW